jgi:hypothetical protein
LTENAVTVLAVDNDEVDPMAIKRRFRQPRIASDIAGFIVKSDAGRGFLAAVEMIERFWCVVELP